MSPEPLASVVARRLALAGISPDAPELEYLRAWNHAARIRGELSVELRRGQFGQTRKLTGQGRE